MVALDEALAKLAVGMCEVEPADFARQTVVASERTSLLALHEVTVTLANPVKAVQKPPLDHIFLTFLRALR